ncbi:large conductance mechanosensitive channel protein MscL [Arthrobacter sp. ok362]|uniref:large conductance mechanosensitive channel protein MscL n=1 Tax=Arthrobacter sp. ok362 TaxID=1761745 RepID=UPI00088811A2|nr:large conductance mechanosensitive channel protein MscL [Arthrobacter sp. ok362]SDL02518.1 large conductance mechanosensitive channel [Arthrobacter sp. ok362]
MLKGFKDFILRGNVIELSIAVVVGTAFTALVSAFTTNIVNPILAAAGGVETQGLGFHIWPGNDKTFVNIGAVVTAFLTFLITAAVVYFIFVAPMNRINRMVKHRLSAAEPAEEPIPADTALLAEIRDLLVNLAGPVSDGGRAGVAEHPAGNTPSAVPAGVTSRQA